MPGDLQALLDTFIADHPDVPGVLAHVEASDWQRTVASGVSDAAAAEPLAPDATFRLASVTKSYVAAAILRLHEAGELSLDAPIGDHLGAELRELLGARRCRRIVLRHLLNHTSGLCDFVTDTDYLDTIANAPERQWSRTDQVRLAMQGCADVGEPGAQVHYSDTGYVLLGAILESATGSDFAQSLRTVLRFDQLGLRSTYIEQLEPAPANARPRVHQYDSGRDTYGANPSFDLWGGGGLVATTTDVARFYRALFEGHFFERSDTLELMLQPAGIETGAALGMGIGGRNIGGQTMYGHGGHWGNYGGYVPARRLALAVAVLERNALGAMATELVPALIDYTPR